jgi:hypothetical protein
VKHAELIRAALDGKRIQVRRRGTAKVPGYYPWETIRDQRLAIADMAAEYPSFEYRLEPKPDRVEFLSWGVGVGWVQLSDRTPSGYQTISAHIDGETGKLKSVEIV